MITTAKTKLAELPITWKEAYTDKTKRLKDMYEDIVGSGSYFRFEGVNRQSGDEYYVVCGPSKVKSPKPMFFSGVRKLPSDFAASGKEFGEMREAIEHAKETWGIEIPASVSYYDADDLKNIGSKAKDWRETHQWTEEDAKEEETKDEDSEDEEDNEDKTEKAASSSSDLYRFSMGAPARVGRQGYKWYDIDHAVLGNDAEFNNDVQQWPGLDKAAQKAYAQREKFRSKIAETYGSENLKSEFYHVWLSFSPEYGAYIVSVGPYFELVDKAAGTYQATDRFDAFWRRLNVFSSDFLDKKVAELLAGYSSKYGVTLTPEDYVPPVQGDLAPEFKLTPAGRDKVYDAVSKIYKLPDGTPKLGLKEELKKKYKEAYPKWKSQLDAAYQKSKESGDAFIKSQPPPPDINWMKPRPIGQQMSSKAHDTGGEEEGSTKGFSTLKEAMEYVNTKSWAGCPMLEGYTDVTSEDLAAARATHAGQQASLPAEAPKPTKKVKTAPTAPVPEEEDIIQPELSDEDWEAIENKVSVGGPGTTADTLRKLVVLADSLDEMGKTAEALEVHKILRKHAIKITWEDDK